MRLIFLGTPAFAVPTLEAVVGEGHQVVAVYTQPDRPKGRGQALAFSPVKEAALRLGLEVRQPERVRRSTDELALLAADAMVVVGYGQIIPQSIIDLPRLGIINVHASLLPRYRGAAPIQWAIARGETVTGVTTMHDQCRPRHGRHAAEVRNPHRARRDLPSTSAPGWQPSERHCLVIQTLSGLAAGTQSRTPQNDADATLAPILKREDGLIDWSLAAPEIHNRARGFLPWPGAWTTFRGQRLQIWTCRPASVAAPAPAACGRLFAAGRRLYASCGGSTVLELVDVQLEGRKRVPASDILNGLRLAESEPLGETAS